MTPIQIILLVSIFIIIVNVLRQYRIKAVTIRECFLWLVFWLLVASLVVFPNATQTVATLVGITRGVDLLIYIALLVLFTALFFILIRLERLEREVTKIVRHLALKGGEKQNK